MLLTVDSTGPGMRGMSALSISHYGEGDGDLVRDPKMCFEIEVVDGKLRALYPD